MPSGWEFDGAGLYAEDASHKNGGKVSSIGQHPLFYFHSLEIICFKTDNHEFDIHVIFLCPEHVYFNINKCSLKATWFKYLSI